MKVAMIVAGAAIILVVLADIFISLVRTPMSQGPFTALGERTVCGALYRLFRVTGRRGLLALIGPASVASRAFMVLAALYLGWSLVLFSDPGWVVSSKSQAPVDFWTRVYYVGYSLSTLGLGDAVPSGVGAMLATVGTSSTGFLVLTFVVGTISPLSNIISAKTSVSTIVDGHREAIRAGADPVDALRETLRAVTLPLVTVSGGIQTLPVRHRMHADSESLALSTALATLERHIEACGLGRDPRAATARRAIDQILEVLMKDWLDDPKVEGDAGAVRMERLKAFVEADRLSWEGTAPPSPVE